MLYTRPFAAALVCLLAGCGLTNAEETRVASSAALVEALAQAEPGDVILLEPGEYPGGLHVSDIHGEEDAPILVRAADPEDPPRLLGGDSGLQLSDVSWLEIDGMHISGAEANGLNIDDGGDYATPTHHITLRHLVIQDIGPDGNRDGIKLSGVDDFRVESCTVERWGSGGSAIDMVGCHRGVITDCLFREGDLERASGVQMKGGSSEIVVRANGFVDAGSRAVNIGGSTGLQYFRPEPQGYEAKDITVEGNIFVGSLAPIAFVGADGAVVRLNTIYNPGRWAVRILQETREAGFAPCRNGVFTDNIVVFRSDRWAAGGLNVGDGTAPETFEFARNLWYCEDDPRNSRPSLPTEETDGLVGVDPEFVDPANGDFRLRDGSPAAGRGHTALEEE